MAGKEDFSPFTEPEPLAIRPPNRSGFGPERACSHAFRHVQSHRVKKGNDGHQGRVR
jgi:hypothetical protein